MKLRITSQAGHEIEIDFQKADRLTAALDRAETKNRDLKANLDSLGRILDEIHEKLQTALDIDEPRRLVLAELVATRLVDQEKALEEIRALPAVASVRKHHPERTLTHCVTDAIAASDRALQEILNRSPDTDIAPCQTCGQPTITVPDGIQPICQPCHEAEANQNDQTAREAQG